MIHPLTYESILKKPQVRRETIFHKHHTVMTMERHVGIIEDYIGNGMMIPEICEKHGIAHSTVSHVITRYFKKPEKNMTLKSKV